MSPNGQQHPDGEGQPDVRPFLTIPYWSNPVAGGSAWDTGTDRPLPGSVISYLCDSIHAGPYTPGQPLDVSVDVRNSGGGSATSIATVVVYWADPTVGFATPTFFAATTVAVPPTRTAPAVTTTRTMTATIPASAPAHICLLVAVSHPQDRAGVACDPVGDRHWAQRNLVAVVAAVGAPALLPIVIANPFARAGDFSVVAGPADERHLIELARAVGKEATFIDATLRLLDENGAQVGESGGIARAGLALEGLEQRRFSILVDVPGGIPPGRMAPFAITLIDPVGERPVGSLGVVIESP